MALAQSRRESVVKFKKGDVGLQTWLSYNCVSNEDAYRLLATFFASSKSTCGGNLCVHRREKGECTPYLLTQHMSVGSQGQRRLPTKFKTRWELTLYGVETCWGQSLPSPSLSLLFRYQLPPRIALICAAAHLSAKPLDLFCVFCACM